MKKNVWKRGLTILLTASLVFSEGSITALAKDKKKTVSDESAAEKVVEDLEDSGDIEEMAEEEPIEEEETEAPTEAPTEPPTEAPTEAPETEAPETQAPETEAPETQAPETEAPETEAPETQAPETEAPETEKEKETEKTTEKKDDHIFVVEKKNYTISVEVPKDMKLPEGTELVVEGRKKDSEEAEKDRKLVKVDPEYQIDGVKFYGIHFELNGEEVEITPRLEKDIEVTIEYPEGLYEGKVTKEEEIQIYHLRKLTEEEILETKENEDEDYNEEDERVAEFLKSEAKWNNNYSAIEKVTFKTDGFSDYAVALVTEVPETELVTEKETETEEITEKASETERITETESETISETESETESETFSEAESEIEPMTEIETESESELEENPDINPVDNEETEEKRIEVSVSIFGNDKLKETKIVLSSEAELDTEKVKAYSGENELKLTFAEDKKAVAITVPIAERAGAFIITGLVPGDYKVDAGGNYFEGEKLTGTEEYYTIYGEDENTAPIVLKVEEDTKLSVTNIYSNVTVTVTEEGNYSNVINGVKLNAYVGKHSVAAAVSDNKGNAVYKGLPPAEYTFKVEKSSIPGQYVEETKEEKLISVPAISGAELYIYLRPISVTIRAHEKGSNEPIKNVTFKVEDESGEVVAKETVNGKGEVILKGVLSRNEKYTVTQSGAAGHYTPGKKRITIANARSQSTTFWNDPTVMKIAVLDDVSETSPFKGEYIAGATVEIHKYVDKKVGTLVKTVKTVNGVLTLKGELDPEDYVLIQTEAPAGYLKDTYAKVRSLKSSEKEALFSNDTVKVKVYRKGYESRTQKAGSGYEYKNMQLLDGAVLRILDADGKEVTDKNGNTVRWTSKKSEDGHMIEGVLAAGTKYKVDEIEEPVSYERFAGGEFTTFTSGNVAKVTLPTGKGKGKITVALKSASEGKTIKMNGKFYFGVYSDSDCTKLSKHVGVKTLEQKDNAIYSTVIFEGLPAGVYYVNQCDGNGKAVRSGSGYTITYENKELHLNAGHSLLAIATHTYEKKPDGSKDASEAEKNSADKGLFSGFGGSQEAAAELAEGDGTGVKTGDTTNIALYAGILAGAFLVIIILLILRRKGRR